MESSKQKTMEVIKDTKESIVWETVTGGQADEYWHPLKEGEEVQGTLNGSFEGNLGRTYLLDVSGRVIGLPSHTALVNTLGKIPVGNIVRCTFLGLVKSAKTSKTYSNYKVEVAREASKYF